MSKTINEQVFEIIDEMYNDLAHKEIDQHIKDILLIAAKHLSTEDMPAQVVAAKTVNGITIWTMNGKNLLGDENAERIRKLMRIARSEGYKWSATGLGSLGVQF